MSHNRKRPTRFARGLAATTAVVAAGLVAVAPDVASAGSYASQTSCATQVLGNRICFDISANTVTVYTSNTTIYAQETIAGPLVASGPVPTKGWIAYDFECNAANVGGTLTTSFKTGPNYGLNGETVSAYAGSGAHGWNNWPVSQAMANIIAWDANSNSGFECVVVP